MEDILARGSMRRRAQNARDGADSRDVERRAPTLRCLERTRELAVGMLKREHDIGLLQHCLLNWRSLASGGIAAQVRASRGQLDHLDQAGRHAESERSEVLRWQAEAARLRSRAEDAEAELARRSRDEFARLREVQLELSRLRAEAVAMAAPQTRPEPRASTAYVVGIAAARHASRPGIADAAARGMALSFATSTQSAWQRVYLSAWRDQAAQRLLVRELVEECAAGVYCSETGRVLVAWWAVTRRRKICSFCETVINAATAPWSLGTLVRAVLWAWSASTLRDRTGHGVRTPASRREAVEGTPASRADSSHVASPQSTPIYRSAVARPCAEELIGSGSGHPTMVACSNKSGEDVLEQSGLLTFRGCEEVALPAPGAATERVLEVTATTPDGFGAVAALIR